jgi:calcineurin-like phosphoesterase family protein
MENAQIPNENKRLYVIGDIHGRLDLLDRLIAMIRRDVEEHGDGALTVTLGDYVDRGLTSADRRGCEPANFRWALSRSILGSAMVRRLLSTWPSTRSDAIGASGGAIFRTSSPRK